MKTLKDYAEESKKIIDESLKDIREKTYFAIDKALHENIALELDYNKLKEENEALKAEKKKREGAWNLFTKKNKVGKHELNVIVEERAKELMVKKKPESIEEAIQKHEDSEEDWSYWRDYEKREKAFRAGVEWGRKN